MKRRKKTDPLAEYMLRDIAGRAEAESRSLLKFICPIFRVDDRGMPEQFGTGTLLGVGDHFFLVTAAHVLDESSTSTLYVPGNTDGVLQTLEGRSFRSALVDGSRRNDHIDVGVVQIKPDFAGEIGHASFLPIEMCDVHDVGARGEVYIAMGSRLEK